MNIKKYIILGILVVCALFFAFGVYPYQFRQKNIEFKELPQEPHTLSATQFNEIQKITAQPFAYLDRGKQSFAFLSQDQKYVLKFFDTRCLQALGFLLYSEPYDLETCQAKFQRLVEGYRVAYTGDKDNSGLIYVQLTPNPLLGLDVQVIDRFGIRHTIDLRRMPFILQYTARTTRDVLTELLAKGDVVGAKHRLHQIIDMYLKSYGRGYYDRDHNFMYNTGFIGDRPIRIDSGRLKYGERFKNRDFIVMDIHKIALDRVDGWLGRHFPQYRKEIVADMQATVDKL